MIAPSKLASSGFFARGAVLGFAALVGIVACSSAAEDAGGGAPNPNGKDEGAQCTAGSECKSLTCAAGKCTPVTGSNPTDGVKNGDETDTDCGGLSAPKCADTKACKVASDCASATCTAGICKAPSPDDGVKNGDETDTDCGGAKAPKCKNDKGCAKNDDCASAACSYAKKCVEFASCTGHFGGDTCGEGETGAGAKHESCCTTATTAGGTRVGKYHITAGRMRAFVERYDGNLQAWAATSPTGWDSGWNDQLPASMADALNALGPNGKRGCNVPSQGGRTYWQPAVNGDANDHSDFPKDVLDEKALNCVTWYMAQALCVSDGGRLLTSAELTAIATNDGANQWPWQHADNSGYNEGAQDPRTVHRYSYQTPNPPADMRTQGGGPLDRSFYMAPPGRRPNANKIGVMDAVGNMLTWANDKPKGFVWTQSWEDHKKDLQLKTWTGANGGGDGDGYYAIGGRCAFE